ncbi:MAG: hypothetical protein JO103_15000 [Candidatus Eremiobacteraeota bacterium]|nr:hypothetical protein [Candidatus Eremiobacteraeota bacterium]MBV9408389.1 hypothetical protein [Candidatus Eremiobacteraeota bacterium]
MRVNQRTVYRYRAGFGLGFVVLGAVTLYRVAVAPAPANTKILGLLLALALMALGGTRIAQYLRVRREDGG